MALCLMPFLGICFLILSISWVIFSKAALQHAVSEGVRYAITSRVMAGKGHDASIKTIVQQNAMGLLNGAQLSKVSIQYFMIDETNGSLQPTNLNLGGNIVEVSVDGYSAVPLAPILAWGRGSRPPQNGAITLSVRASDRMEGSPGGIPPHR